LTHALNYSGILRNIERDVDSNVKSYSAKFAKNT
jgi:hypothetical protein